MFLQEVGAMISLVAYYLLYKLVTKSPENYNIITFFLWAVLELISTISLAKEDGYYILALSQFCGSAIIFSVLLVQKNKIGLFNNIFTNEDFALLLLILISMFLWATEGNMTGIIASIFSSLLAGGFQMKDSKNRPDKESVKVWFLFLIAGIITFFASELNEEEPKSIIIEKLYAISEIMDSFALIILNLGLFSRKN